MRRRALIAALAAAAVLFAGAAPARAIELEWSGGIKLGGGGFVGPGSVGAPAGFDFGFRGDMLVRFGRDPGFPWRIGPAFELRGLDVRTTDLGAGVTFFPSIPSLFAAGVTVLTGYAWRPLPTASTPYLAISLFGGIRLPGSPELKYLAPFAGLYFTIRTSLVDPHFVELDGGLEIDPVGMTLLLTKVLMKAFKN